MSHGDRDQRGRPHSGKDCPESQNGGCHYCRTGEYKQADRRSERHQKRDAVLEQLASTDGNGPGNDPDPHVYVGERCIRCNANAYDVGIYPGLDDCPGKPADNPITYSTTTGEEPVSSHRFDL